MRKCSFCGNFESSERKLLTNNDDSAFICEYCANAAFSAFHGDEKKVETSGDYTAFDTITPKGLKAVLDNYVIGQERAKKVFSVGVYNHYKRIFKQSDDDTELAKSNILLIGPTGSGKTLVAQTLARFLHVPSAIWDATSLTEAGYVGEDVENILTKLYQAAGCDIKKAEQGIVFVDEIDKIARMGENRSITRDVSGEGVQQALLKIIEGSSVNIPPNGGRKHPNQEFVQIDTTNILFVCGGAFDGLNEIIERRVGKNVLGFNQNRRGKKERQNAISLVEPDDLVHFGLIPELIGRLHSITTLNEITTDDMVRILTEPKNALLRQYEKLFAMDGAKLMFDDEAVREVANLAIKRKTGARGLRSIMEEMMTDIMFDLPELNGYEVHISKDVVDKKAEPLLIKVK